MKAVRVAIVLALTAGMAAPAAAKEWTIDPAHTTVSFKVSHLVVSRVSGKFTEFSGTIVYDDDLSKGSVSVTIQAASIDTDNEDRDKHLRSPDFLDAEKFPTITFRSKKVIPGEGNRFRLVGDLTIKGITREVTFDCKFGGTVTDPWGNTRMGFAATATINRQDFGVSWNKTLDTGGLVVGNEVELTIEGEAILKK